MEGPSSSPHDEQRGLIPRAVEQIFAHCEALLAKGWQYTLEVMFLEIYNEGTVIVLGRDHVLRNLQQR